MCVERVNTTKNGIIRYEIIFGLDPFARLTRLVRSIIYQNVIVPWFYVEWGVGCAIGISARVNIVMKRKKNFNILGSMSNFVDAWNQDNFWITLVKFVWVIRTYRPLVSEKKIAGEQKKKKVK